MSDDSTSSIFGRSDRTTAHSDVKDSRLALCLDTQKGSHSNRDSIVVGPEGGCESPSFMSHLRSYNSHPKTPSILSPGRTGDDHSIYISSRGSVTMRAPSVSMPETPKSQTFRIAKSVTRPIFRNATAGSFSVLGQDRYERPAPPGWDTSGYINPPIYTACALYLSSAIKYTQIPGPGLASVPDYSSYMKRNFSLKRTPLEPKITNRKLSIDHPSKDPIASFYASSDYSTTHEKSGSIRRYCMSIFVRASQDLPLTRTTKRYLLPSF